MQKLLQIFEYLSSSFQKRKLGIKKQTSFNFYFVLCIELLLLFVVIDYIFFKRTCFTQAIVNCISLTSINSSEHFNEYIIIVLGLITFLITSIINLLLKKHIEKTHIYFIDFIRKIILRRMPNEENTYSLFDNFMDIKVNRDLSFGDSFSINGLVKYKNKESVSLEYTSDQFNSFYSKIENKQNLKDKKCGSGCFFEKEDQKENIIRIFTADEIRISINNIKESLSDPKHTFRFIADQYGVSYIEQKKQTLIINVYNTTYYTFRIMNDLFNRHKIIISPLVKRFCENINNNKIRKEGFEILFPFFSALGVNVIIESFLKGTGNVTFISRRGKDAFGGKSQNHVPVNETFSFTDLDGNNNPSIKCCVIRGLKEEIGINLKEEDEIKKDSFKPHDIFINPERGMLGLSGIFHLKDNNPSYFKYYPGIDKIMESSSIEYIRKIKKYGIIKEIFKFSEWVAYTPFLYKRYFIREQNLLNTLKASKHIYPISLIAIIVYYLIIFLFYFHIIHEKFLIKTNSLLVDLSFSILTGIMIGVFIAYTAKKISYIYHFYTKNPKMESLGKAPFGKHVVMYGGNDDSLSLIPGNILISIRTDFLYTRADLKKAIEKDKSISFSGNGYSISESCLDCNKCDQYNFDFKIKTPINIQFKYLDIVSIEAKNRKVEKDKEYPTLLIKANLKALNCRDKITQEPIIIRNYYCGKDENGDYFVTYKKTEEGFFTFGEDIPIDNLFNLREIDKTILSDHTNHALDIQGYKNTFHAYSHIGDIRLYDIYKRQINKTMTQIIITRIVEAPHENAKEWKVVKSSDKNKLVDKLIKLVEGDLNRSYDELDILMLQQLLIRIEIYLFKKK